MRNSDGIEQVDVCSTRITVCPSDSALLEYLHGTRNAATSSAMQEHLDLCRVCRKALSILVALASSASNVPRETAPAGRLEPLPAERIGRYLILHVLGRGGMGVVYEAYDPELDRKVALKLVYSANRSVPTRDDIDTLHGEAAKMARLCHPNAVTVFDAGIDGDRLFIAMELMTGGTLRAYESREGASWMRTLRLLLEAGRGLAAAHAIGLIHRDFKPENVLVDGDGRAKVADFGLAQSAAVERNDGAGTPRYMAPEQRDRRTVDPRCDQYSFCVTALEFLAPRDGTEASKLPAGLRATVERGASSNASDRYPSMDALLDDLSAFVAAPAARGSLIWWVSAVAAVALAVTATALAMSESPQETEVLASPWRLGESVAVMGSFVRYDPKGGLHEWQPVHRALSSYASEWQATQQSLTRVSGYPLDGLVREMRVRCLAQKRAEFTATVDLLRQADARVLSRSMSMVRSLGQPSECGLQAGARRLAVAPPVGTQDAVDSVRRRAGEVLAELRAARYPEARALAKDLLEDAEQTGHLPTVGYVRYLYADSIARTGDIESAQEEFAEAARESAYGADLEQVARTYLVIAQRRTGIAADPARAAQALSA
ncbi:MAG: serine/threonine protein kinase, partial [Nannocystaceae bacterium]|nr:serine/threonine protein kinase [Nannocystaceae bacterium]